MSTNAQRLGEAVRQRRKELDLTQLEVWQSGGPSNTTLTTIENGEATSLVRTTARKLDVGLQWEPGSARRVWDGTGEARPALRVDRVDEEFVAAVQRAGISDQLRESILAAIEAEQQRRLEGADDGNRKTS